MDLAIRKEIFELSETPNNAEVIFIKYNQMIDKADMKLYNSILRSVCILPYFSYWFVKIFL